MIRVSDRFKCFVEGERKRNDLSTPELTNQLAIKLERERFLSKKKRNNKDLFEGGFF